MSGAAFILGSASFNLAASVLYILASLSAVIPMLHRWWHNIQRELLGMTPAQYKQYRAKLKKQKKSSKKRGISR